MSEQFISFNEAVAILKDELKYPEERALHFVKLFDHNGDGQLSTSEFNLFKGKIEETKTQLVPMFKEYDVDSNGYITLKEAADILQHEPFNFPPDKVLALLKNFDKDGNGKLDIEEFAGFYAEAKATKDDIAARFDALDKDGNGVLTPDEVVNVLKDLLGFDEQTARFLIEMFDTNQDGSLDKAEFVHLWTGMFGQ